MKKKDLIRKVNNNLKKTQSNQNRKSSPSKIKKIIHTKNKWKHKKKTTNNLLIIGRFYISWLFIVSLTFLYNAWVIPLRSSFKFQTIENTPIWLTIDYICDIIYLLDVIFVKHRLIYLYSGFWQTKRKDTRLNYMKKLQFKVRIVFL